MHITKWRLAAAIIALITVASSAAYADHVFSDVEDGQFYADATEWAKDNAITFGCGDGKFCPNDAVTRGENITFAKRYDDNIVQPALAAQQAEIDAAEADIATQQAEIDAAEAAIATKADATAVYTQAEVDAAVLAAMAGTAPIPSGTTVTGWGFFVDSIVADDALQAISIELPGIASTPLTQTTVNADDIASAADGNADCTGTATTPTAPAGEVCIYFAFTSNADGFFGSTGNIGNDRGFVIAFSADGSAGAGMQVEYVWAYTAP